MNKNSQGLVEFHGLDGRDPPTEAEDFIAAIRREAFREQKQRDNDWLCDYAATCFRGEALRWLAKLEIEKPDVTENWKLLQNAILQQYPRAADPGTDTQVLTPAADQSVYTVSESDMSVSAISEALDHRIRVVNEHGESIGYLGHAGTGLPGYWEGCLNAACNEADAFRVRIRPDSDGSRLSRIYVLGAERLLGIQWQESFRSRAAVTLIEEEPGTRLVSKLPPDRWEGEARVNVWDVGMDGKIIPQWRNKKGIYETYGFIAYEPNYAWGTAVVHVKPKAWSYALRNIKWDFVTLELEEC